MKQRIRLGLVCLARETFDFKAAEELYGDIRKDVAGLEAVDWEIVSDLVISVEDSKAAAARLASARIDALVCISGTFHLGHLVLELRKAVPVPILLWGLDELPYNGGKIRLNSVCGVNLNASNLYKAGVDEYRAVVGPKIDEAWVDAIRVMVALRDAHVGLLGYRAHGFFNLSLDDPSLYAATGILVDHYELSDVHGFKVDPRDGGKRSSVRFSRYRASPASKWPGWPCFPPSSTASWPPTSSMPWPSAAGQSLPGTSAYLPARPCPSSSPKARFSPAKGTWREPSR